MNDPFKECTAAGNICIPELQQKQVESSVSGDLRNVNANVIPFRIRTVRGQDRPSHYISKLTFSGTFTQINIIRYNFAQIPDVGNDTAIGTINKISSTTSPVPGLTQNDSTVRYCNEHDLPKTCTGDSICYCPHLVQLKLCGVYEFLLMDVRGLNRYRFH